MPDTEHDHATSGIIAARLFDVCSSKTIPHQAFKATRLSSTVSQRRALLTHRRSCVSRQRDLC
jgi:hypothetical protein